MLGSSSAGSPSSELERLQRLVARYFPVYESRIGPQSLLLAVHADPKSLAEKFDQLRQELWTLGYVPILRREHGEDFVEVVRRPKLGRRRVWINVVLLAATIATTVFAGAMIWLAWAGRLTPGPSDFLYGALYFAGPLLLILGVHETAHYLVARRHHLDASLPYFIPIPPPYILGTFGAFVSMREPFPDRRALFDVGVAGPLAGFVMSLPIALGGLALSVHAPAQAADYCGPTFLGQNYGNLLLGPSLLWYGLTLFFPAGIVNLHPLALAGWVGVLVTAINLIPAGTLDGGHIFRAVFGVLVLVLGLRHPPPLNDLTPLDTKRYLLGGLVAAILVGGFVLVPISTPQGSIGFGPAVVQPLGSPPPGQAVAANLSVPVANHDPVAHAFLFSVEVTNVSARVGNGTQYLNRTALEAWAANASWVFYLPGTGTFGPIAGGSASSPANATLAINASSTRTPTVLLENTESAVTATVLFSASEICPPVGGGSASTQVQLVF